MPLRGSYITPWRGCPSIGKDTTRKWQTGILGSCGNADLFLLECSGLRVFFPPPHPAPEKLECVGPGGRSMSAVSPAVCKPLPLYCVVYIDAESVVLAIWELIL